MPIGNCRFDIILRQASIHAAKLGHAAGSIRSSGGTGSAIAGRHLLRAPGGGEWQSPLQPHVASHRYVGPADIGEGKTEDVHQLGKGEVRHEDEVDDHVELDHEGCSRDQPGIWSQGEEALHPWTNRVGHPKGHPYDRVVQAKPGYQDQEDKDQIVLGGAHCPQLRRQESAYERPGDPVQEEQPPKHAGPAEDVYPQGPPIGAADESHRVGGNYDEETPVKAQDRRPYGSASEEARGAGGPEKVSPGAPGHPSPGLRLGASESPVHRPAKEQKHSDIRQRDEEEVVKHDLRPSCRLPRPSTTPAPGLPADTGKGCSTPPAWSAWAGGGEECTPR